MRSFLAEPKNRITDVVVAVLGALVVGVSLQRHDMWFDELQAWGVARAANDLGGLFQNIQYEGHPPLWYLLLYGITRFTGDPHWMQVASWALASTSFSLIVICAPWPRAIRYAAASGYFFVFEFAAISRSYVLGVFLLVLALVAHRTNHVWWRATLLCLLAMTSLMGAVLVLSFASYFVLQRKFQLSIALAVASFVAVFISLPPSDSAVGSGFGGAIGSSILDRIAAAMASPLGALVPLPYNGAWNTLAVNESSKTAQVVASLLLVALIAAVLTPRGRVFWLVGVVGFMAFFGLAYPPTSLRHTGHIAVLLFAVCWVEPPSLATKTSRFLFGVLLAVQVATGVLLTGRYFVNDFGPNESIARQVSAYGDDFLLVAQNTLDGVPVGAYLDLPVFSIGAGGPVRYVTYDRQSFDRSLLGTTEATLAYAEGLKNSTGRRVVVLLADQTVVLI